MKIQIEIEKIKNTMLENGVEEDTVDAIIKQLQEDNADEIPEPEETPDPENDEPNNNSDDLPKVKYEYVIILNDKEGYLKDKEIAGWVVQQEENADAGLILPKLVESAKDQNSGNKKKHSICDFVSLFEYLKPKWFKSKNIKIKTKDLTRVIISNGKMY